MERQSITCVKPFHFSDWHVGFCYFTGLFKNRKVFIKACTGQYDTTEAEYKIICACSRHIPTVYDRNTDPIPYIVTDYIEAIPFADVKTPDEYIDQAAELLDDLYKYGVINRDINPENLMVDKQGVLVLIDYGWAVFRDSKYQKSPYVNIEQMLNREFRCADGSFDDAYSMYQVFHKAFNVPDELLRDIRIRIGRLKID